MNRAMSAALVIWMGFLIPASLTMADEAAIRRQVDQVLALAKEGWTLADFYAPRDAGMDKPRRLRAMGLPENYDSFAPQAKQALEKYYAPMAAGRPSIPLEDAVAEYIKAPADAAARAKVVELMSRRIEGFDPGNERLTFSAIIPDRVWTKPPADGRTMNLDDATFAKRESALVMQGWLGTHALRGNHRWKALLTGYGRIIEGTYPRVVTLEQRATIHMVVGEFDKAIEDTLLWMAVDAWERANSLGAPDSTVRLRKVQTGLMAARVYAELAAGDPTSGGALASKPLGDAVTSLQSGDWSGVVQFAMARPISRSPAYELRRLIRLAFGNELLDAVAEEYARSDAARRKELWAAFKDLADLRASTAMIGYRIESSERSRENHLQAAVSDGAGNPDAFNELGKWYEQRNDTTNAILAYNVAADGQAADRLEGIPRLAAAARDRLEGPTDTLPQLYAVYNAPYTRLSDEAGKKLLRMPRKEMAFYEGILSRFLNRGIRRSILIGARADVRQAMGDTRGAIADLREQIEMKLPNAAASYAMIGTIQDKNGDYDGAAASYTAAIVGGYAKAWVYYNRGIDYRRIGQFDKMLADMTAAIQVDAKFPKAYEARSEYYEYVAGDYSKALADARSAKAIYVTNQARGSFGVDSTIARLGEKIAREN